MRFFKSCLVVIASIVVSGMVAPSPGFPVAALPSNLVTLSRGLPVDNLRSLDSGDSEVAATWTGLLATPKSDHVLRLGFLQGSATLFPGGRVRLQPIINEWMNQGILTIEAVGHTSTEEIPERRLRNFKDHYELSNARALAIAEYLAEQLGIPKQNIAVVGRGADEPLKSNESQRGREFNDRVEVTIGLADAVPLPVRIVESFVTGRNRLALSLENGSKVVASIVPEELNRDEVRVQGGTALDTLSVERATTTLAIVEATETVVHDEERLAERIQPDTLSVDRSSTTLAIARAADTTRGVHDTTRGVHDTTQESLQPDTLSVERSSATLAIAQVADTTRTVYDPIQESLQPDTVAVESPKATASIAGTAETARGDEEPAIKLPTPIEIIGGTNTTEFAGGIAETVYDIYEPMAIASYLGGVVSRFVTPNDERESGESAAFDSHPSITGLPAISRRKPLQPSRWSASVGGRIGTAYDSNIFEKPDAPTSSGILDTALRGELARDINPNDRITVWAGATAAPSGVSGAPDEYTGLIGSAFRHRLSKSVSVTMLAQAKMENDDIVNKEGEDPLRQFAHSEYQAQPSVQLRTRNNSLIWVSYVVQRRNFREQVELNSLDWWQHGPSIKLRSPLGNRGGVEIDYAFRVQSYDEEQASLRTGKFLETNPTERHRFDRVEADLFFRPNSNLELITGYCVERKEDSFLGFESWTNQCVRSGVHAMIGRRVTVRGAVSYDYRKYDNRLADDKERLRYSRVSGEASVGYRLSRAVTLYGSVWAANRNSNRSIGDEYLDLGVFRMSSGATFAY